MQQEVEPYREARTRILILGAGFGGIGVATGLDSLLADRSVDVLVADRSNAMLFTPLMWSVADGRAATRDVMVPIRAFQRGHRFHVLYSDVEQIDIGNRTVQTTAGTYPYDRLVIALGSVTALPPVPGLREHVLLFRLPADAIRLRNRLISAIERARQTTDPAERQALLTFVVVGGGDTGVEVAATINDYLKALFERYPWLTENDVRIVLVERMDRLIPMAAMEAADRTREILMERGIEIHVATAVESVTADAVLTSAGPIPTHTVFWAAGITAPEVVRALPLEHAPNGAVIVDEYLRVPGHPEINVVGDAAWAFDASGHAVPPTAQAAQREGAYVARTLTESLRGKDIQPFRYRSLGHLTLLGLHTGLAEVGPFLFTGFPAWALWHAYYLYQLPSWSNRAHLVADWVLAALFGRQTTQLRLD